MKKCQMCMGLDPACPVCTGVHEPGRPPVGDYRQFGTEACPLHASQLQKLLQCSWRSVMTFLYDFDGESGPAADTGSATHAAIAAWHQNGKDPGAAVRSMVERHGEFPNADLDEAAALFLLYCQDPRNVEAEVVAVEKKVKFWLDPAPTDPTGAPILVVGTCDQVRDEDGELKVYDIKTSKRSGFDLMMSHEYQIAAYCFGCSIAFGRPVGPGSLVCPRHYPRGTSPASRPGGVFFPYPWTFRDVGLIMNGVRQAVAAVRSGVVFHNGGDHCRWCPAGSPDACVPMLRQAVDLSTFRLRTPASAEPMPAEVVDVEF